ncbi:helix-turn-helix transcriptional regulator [Klebsiella quasipneumoniae]|uniref:helix-turn-helix transcriptional regulator n=1 Tax=Klebsiella quasipneumoniae TaxID=1463165 RepID=UPI0023E1B2DD|nr:helix-turn-helix transcriptional regulator [Klebsiella quasipneumoniae]
MLYAEPLELVSSFEVEEETIEELINPERLTEAREAKGLTMADLARLLEISRQAISAFEKGLKNPSHETLNQISRRVCLRSLGKRFLRLRKG